MKSEKRARVYQADWWSKTIAGGLLGLLFAFIVSGLFIELAQIKVTSAKAQLAMWLFIPVWLGVFSTSYLFIDGKRAWWWLSGANVMLLIIYLLVS